MSKDLIEVLEYLVNIIGNKILDAEQGKNVHISNFVYLKGKLEGLYETQEIISKILEHNKRLVASLENSEKPILGQNK